MQAKQSGEEFKNELRDDKTKMGLFINSNSTVICEQLSLSSYDWLLVDTQHGPFDYQSLSNQVSAVNKGNALSMVRVGGFNDRIGIQQSLDAGANGILIPYVNTRAEVDEGVNSCLYPEPSKHKGNKSVYFPLRCMNEGGLLGYAGSANKNTVIAIQIETMDCINNIDEILANPHVDVAFLGRNDLAMSMGLFEKYKFPDMYTSPELNEAIDKMLAACKKHNKIAGLFLFGTADVESHIKKGFRMISVGNDLHHILTANTQMVSDLRDITKNTGHNWAGQKSVIIN
jgi:2-keto-3-deoxy-L-rhamnonate aldolase RhmA